MKLEELKESVDIQSMQKKLMKLAKEEGFMDVKPDTDSHGKKAGEKLMVSIKADLGEYSRTGFMKTKEFQQLKKKVKATFGDHIVVKGWARETPGGPTIVMMVPEKSK